MRAAFALSVAALAGSALAAPHYGQVKQVQNVHVVVETVVHTVFFTQTEGYQVATSTRAHKPKPKPKPTSSAAPVVAAAPVVETIYEAPAPAPTSTQVYVAPPAPTTYAAAPAPTTAAPAPAPTAEPSPAPAPAPVDSGYQGIVDTWRKKLGLKALTNSAKLQANALDTVVSSNGKMEHKLNDGTMGQVLAPGGEDDFEHVFVGGWLCEIPSLPGLDGVCAKQSEGWTYEGQTGHAEILTDKSYKEIGCALHAGIWCCDLA